MVDVVDVAVIGGGPAALTAALYLARAGRSVKVFERRAFGGELNQTAKIANYPGYEGSGAKLGEKFRKQAEAAGAELIYGECTKVEPLNDEDAANAAPATYVDGACADGEDTGASAFSGMVENDSKSAKSVSVRGAKGANGFELTIDGEPVRARAVLVATGSAPKTLGFEITPPVSYCALCDGDFAKGKHVAVLGGGNAAAQEALYLAPLAHSIDLITHSNLKADAVLQRELERQSNITIHEQLEPTRELLDAYDYVFIFIGKKPSTEFLQDLTVQTLVNKKMKLLDLEITKEINLLDDDGFIVTGHFKHIHTKVSGDKYASGKHCYAHETAIPGIFAAGDVRSGMLRQVVTAAGDGAAAATEINEFLRQA